ncbi:hypothetical protein Tco_0662425 [Tanacetum coccineum]
MKMPMSSDIKLTKDEEGKSVDNTKYMGMIEDPKRLILKRLSVSSDTLKALRTWDYGILRGPKQTALAISTTEAEYVSARKACQQALWMQQALIDYDIRLDDIPIMCDNKGAIDLSKNSLQHSLMEWYPDLDNGQYDVVDRVMRLLALVEERKVHKDRGVKKGRHSTPSSSAFHHRSASYQFNDDEEIQDEATGCAKVVGKGDQRSIYEEEEVNEDEVY